MEDLDGLLTISPKNPNSHLTVKEREKVSFPTRILYKNKKIKGRILDFGCGLGKDIEFLKTKNFDVAGFDPYYFKDKPEGKFDTILCNYVLNVLLEREQLSVLMLLAELLNPTGFVYYAVRRDLKYEGFRRHFIHKKMTYQTNVILTFRSYYKNKFCEIYEYRHYNQVRYSNRHCPFCSPTNRWKLITESPNVFSVFDLFPKSKGHALIIPKIHEENYFKISEKIKSETWVMVDRVMKIIKKKYEPSGFSVKINVGKASGQKINHTAIHLIPRY